MQCMIFAAGLGTRLYPFTENKPKALVEVNGKPLLEILIEKLIAQRFTTIVVNAHHFSEQIFGFFEKRNFDAEIFVVDEKEELLDTGGGFKNALNFFNLNKPVLLHNVDILSNIHLGELYKYHLSSTADAMLAVSDRKTSRYLLFYENRMIGWKNVQTNQVKGNNINIEKADMLAFSGIQVINPQMLQQTKLSGKFSMIDLYLEQAEQKVIQPFIHSPQDWLDVGTPQSLEKAQDFLKRQ